MGKDIMTKDGMGETIIAAFFLQEGMRKVIRMSGAYITFTQIYNYG